MAISIEQIGVSSPRVIVKEFCFNRINMTGYVDLSFGYDGSDGWVSLADRRFDIARAYIIDFINSGVAIEIPASGVISIEKLDNTLMSCVYPFAAHMVDKGLWSFR